MPIPRNPSSSPRPKPPAAGITTTLGDLVAAAPSLRRVSEQDGLTAKLKYHVAMLAKQVAAKTQFYAEQRQQLFVELGVERNPLTEIERQKHGATVLEVLPDAMKEFQRRLKELLDVPVTIEWAAVRSVDLPHARASDLVDLGPLCELVEPAEEVDKKEPK